MSAADPPSVAVLIAAYDAEPYVGQAVRSVLAQDYPADRLLEQGIVVRDLPGAGRLRASVGAWNDDDDLHRLVTALA